MNYQDWIDLKYPTKESAVNKCRNASHLMILEFPELELQVGFVNRQMHCWCKTDDGRIVDPTAHQFDFELNYDDYKLVSNTLLRRDQVEPDLCIVHLDDGQTIVAY